ncbi:hypothetical protein VU05_01100 [Desulfobulbus sp. F1]|nr:hypothetical protein [Desulfobulbus sp. F1]
MLKTALQRPHEFIITYELIPGQGSSGRRVERMLDFARHVKADGRSVLCRSQIIPAVAQPWLRQPLAKSCSTSVLSR